MRDFSKQTTKALASKGIQIIGTTYLPDNSAALPYASGETGYNVNDNGTHRVLTFAQVIAKAEVAR